MLNPLTENYYQAGCDRDAAYDAYLEKHRDEFDLELKRAMRSVRAGDQQKQIELMDKLDVADLPFEMAALIAEIFKPNVTLEAIRQHVEIRVIGPAAKFYADKEYEPFPELMGD